MLTRILGVQGIFLFLDENRWPSWIKRYIRLLILRIVRNIINILFRPIVLWLNSIKVEIILILLVNLFMRILIITTICIVKELLWILLLSVLLVHISFRYLLWILRILWLMILSTLLMIVYRQLVILFKHGSRIRNGAKFHIWSLYLLSRLKFKGNLKLLVNLKIHEKSYSNSMNLSKY